MAKQILSGVFIGATFERGSIENALISHFENGGHDIRIAPVYQTAPRKTLELPANGAAPIAATKKKQGPKEQSEPKPKNGNGAPLPDLVLQLIAQAKEPVSLAELRAHVEQHGKKGSSITPTINQLFKDNRIKRVGIGLYERGDNSAPPAARRSARPSKSGRTGHEIVADLFRQRGEGATITIDEIRAAFKADGFSIKTAATPINMAVRNGLAKRLTRGLYEIAKGA